uniref:F-box domain-containing protein n=1 Tax=Aureoumbra lagunensis TaxID=44058 RepID=A0A7S3K2E1_9STRA|mmetsp:Transcript_3723/g.5681  ORF Transcript_3723/g.5681 Transcript_3723/m.5681 type:complete len:307 (+) Transcript_3723:122-1042(+)
MLNELLPEFICFKILELISAKCLAQVSCTAKSLLTNVKVVCKKILKSEHDDLHYLLKDLEYRETRLYDFDGFSENAFAISPRTGNWLSRWTGEVRLEKNKFRFSAYSPQSQIFHPLEIASNVSVLDSSVGLTPDVLRIIFTNVQPLVVCFHSSKKCQNRGMNQANDNFYGPSERWMPLFRLVEDVDLVTAPLTTPHNVAAALARRDAVDRPYIRENAPVAWPTFRLRYGDLLLFPHRQFRKLQSILGSEKYFSFAIPNEDMDIYMGGPGTTPALILISLEPIPDDFLRACPSVNCLHWPAAAHAYL